MPCQGAYIFFMHRKNLKSKWAQTVCYCIARTLIRPGACNYSVWLKSTLKSILRYISVCLSDWNNGYIYLGDMDTRNLSVSLSVCPSACLSKEYLRKRPYILHVQKNLNPIGKMWSFYTCCPIVCPYAWGNRHIKHRNKTKLKSTWSNVLFRSFSLSEKMLICTKCALSVLTFIELSLTSTEQTLSWRGPQVVFFLSVTGTDMYTNHMSTWTN